MTKKITEFVNFESALEELETVVTQMESGKLSLEDSLQKFEHGVSLAKLCQAALQTAEQKVQILIAKNGELKPEPFLVEE